MSEPTIAVVETAAGRSAVAVVRVAGPKALRAVEACFLPAVSRTLAETAKGVIRFGRWLAPEGEEVVVCRSASSDRETGEREIVEVHCHGGSAAVAAVMRSLVERGCREEPWTSSIKGSGLSQVMADAQVALRHALTERAAAILLDQAQGALQAALRECLADSDPAVGVERLDAVLRWSDLGTHLTTPWRVVLAGAPNVGKSSLINALLGYARAIVFDQPGTTRDVVTADAAIDGWPIMLADTAGLHESPDSSDELDATESAGIALARQVVTDADLVLEVRDASQSAAHVDLWGDCPPRRRLVVLNKIDLLDTQQLPLSPADEQVVQTSATTGQGVEQLLAAIARRLVPVVPPAGAAAPISDEQVERLTAARGLLAAGEVDQTQAILRALLAPADD